MAEGFRFQSRGTASVQGAHGGLLEAVVAVAEDLSLDAVLERVVKSACRLVHARMGPSGVIGEDRR